MKTLTAAVLGLALVIPAWAADAPAAGDVASVAAAQKGKRVTLVLASGTELTGTVREATDKLVILDSLSGREYFDAHVDTGEIAAVLVRRQP